MSKPVSTLPHVLSGQRVELIDSKAGRISFYVDGPEQAEPMLLVHSINAAASAHEIKPIFDVYKQRRRTYAIDLPGFGHSDRSQRQYCQTLMVDAVIAMLREIRERHPDRGVDLLAVSLACEFAAKAAVSEPDIVRTLGLVSPTGFAKITATHGPPDADLGKPMVHRIISLPLVGKALFGLLTIRPSIRFFLKKTWGKAEIDEEMFENAARLSRTPNAHRAPLCFVAGYLFSADIRSVFRQITQPVWLSHGVRGDFVDYTQTEGITEQSNWHTTVFDTGALPYFEVPEEFIKAYDTFLELTQA
ncbi:MAG: alpha/beta hydrolase [Wenzhouxiangella sp.]|jgi:pimeloyl-ACP methyl ester carboxylesterase|nr:alpha/beta hydrolase [Wenzhouxiangella sp.]